MNGKFKVWDSENKIFIKTESPEFFVLSENGLLYLYDEKGVLNFFGKRFVVVRSTGKPDKNGVEIYDKHIVKATGKIGTLKTHSMKSDSKGNLIIHTNNNHLFVPMEKIGSNRLVEWDDDICGWAPFCEYDDDYGERNPPEYFEIIGSKFENPELLETT